MTKWKYEHRSGSGLISALSHQLPGRAEKATKIFSQNSRSAAEIWNRDFQNTSKDCFLTTQWWSLHRHVHRITTRNPVEIAKLLLALSVFLFSITVLTGHRSWNCHLVVRDTVEYISIRANLSEGDNGHEVCICTCLVLKGRGCRINQYCVTLVKCEGRFYWGPVLGKVVKCPYGWNTRRRHILLARDMGLRVCGAHGVIFLTALVDHIKGCAGRGMWHVWRRGGVHRGLWQGNLTEWDHFEDLDLCGRIVLKRIFKKRYGGVDWRLLWTR